eukprot:TRINITY_DN2787_c0_g1_i4.p1 TRINITY_DN2787_c0_g1~~TRINITY_DN2787_c0_g1_i4.p1  ORF type:complete len:157 (-),score=30.23 TRINITY_DN2787_c0_g1_i4:157-600(-)
MGDEADAKQAGPVTMNAFDLINMVGGAAINRIFQIEEKKIKTFTQFTSNLPIGEIMERISATLTALNVNFKIKDRTCKAKGQLLGPKGLVVFSVQVFVMAPGLHCIECRKISGDVFGYHSFYKQFHAALSDIEAIALSRAASLKTST